MLCLNPKRYRIANVETVSIRLIKSERIIIDLLVLIPCVIIPVDSRTGMITITAVCTNEARRTHMNAKIIFFLMVE